jgi:hypothetical protein
MTIGKGTEIRHKANFNSAPLPRRLRKQTKFQIWPTVVQLTVKSDTMNTKQTLPITQTTYILASRLLSFS